MTAALVLTIVLVGDSTVTDKSGWGLGFARMLLDPARVVNLSLGGRSSKSYRDEGHWTKVLAAKGDYVLLQFGHNDCPGKGPERETDPDTTFYANMARYVDEARAGGAQVVLVTSLVRRNFDPGGQIRADDLVRYAAAVRKLAADKQAPLIDLLELSTALANRMGPRESDSFGPVDADGKVDHTHLNEAGSQAIGAMVARELAAAVPALARYIQHEP